VGLVNTARQLRATGAPHDQQADSGS
jgi:hypothetical protein